MLLNVPEVDIQNAGLTAVNIGQVGLGPISVAQLVVNDANLSITSGRAVLRSVRVTVTLRIKVEWHVGVSMPDGIPDIDISRTTDLGSLSFGMPVGDIDIPSLNNINVNVASLTAQNVSVAADPLSIQLGNATAEQIQATGVTAPSAGFTIAGLSLNNVQGSNVSLPAAGVAQASIGHVHGDAIGIPSVSLRSLSLPAAQIPQVTSTAPLDIPANLQGPGAGFDAGILRLVLRIVPSALTHVEHLDITSASAHATVGGVVLRNVTLPYDVHNLTLSQVGINNVGIPAFSVA